jgi:hypothetical protein
VIKLYETNSALITESGRSGGDAEQMSAKHLLISLK